MRINPTVSEWLNLFARWLHVFAGILWIGQTYLFTWLDGELNKEEKSANQPAQVWMVHSGGFYVAKSESGRTQQKATLVRYEAALTWLSGMVLLVSFITWAARSLTRRARHQQRHGCSHRTRIAGRRVIVYDVLCHTPLVKNDLAFAVVAFSGGCPAWHTLDAGVIGRELTYTSARCSARSCFLTCGRESCPDSAR